MRGFLSLIAVTVGMVLLLGCAEESLDVPLVIPSDLELPVREVAEIEPAAPQVVHDWIGAPRPGFEPPAEQDSPSAAASVWHALLEGTAHALEEQAHNR